MEIWKCEVMFSQLIMEKFLPFGLFFISKSLHFIYNCFFIKPNVTQPRIKIKVVFWCILNFFYSQWQNNFHICKWQSCGILSFSRVEKKAAIQLVPLNLSLNFFLTGAVCVSKLVKYVENVCSLMVYLLDRLPTFQFSLDIFHPKKLKK